MNAALTTALAKRKPCATRNQDKPVSGWILAALVCGVLTFGVAVDVHYAIASLLK